VLEKPGRKTARPNQRMPRRSLSSAEKKK